MLKRYFILVSLILSHISFIYPNSGVKSIKDNRDKISKSKIIISGRSSIIIESKENNTKITASKIETMLGGQLKRTFIKNDNISKNTNDVRKAVTETGFDNGLPKEFTIKKAYPNPFNPTTRIRYAVPTPSAVNVAIYDMTGRLVSAYKIGDKTPGWYEFTWQGTDSHGQQVSTGMYLVTMRAGEDFQRQKVTFLK